MKVTLTHKEVCKAVSYYLEDVLGNGLVSESVKLIVSYDMNLAPRVQAEATFDKDETDEN